MAAAGKDNDGWLIYVREKFAEHELGAGEAKASVCIFGIAHPLLTLRPEAYIPQVISIGPYHHRKLHQYEETDTYKLKVARILEREIDGFKFTTLVEKIGSFDGQIRACYHKHIPYNTQNLSWMLALDASFILRFLKSIYKPYTNNEENETCSPMPYDPILDPKRNTPLWYAIRNDILMLENQVPMQLLIEAFCLTTTKYNHSDRPVGSSSEEEIWEGDGRHQEREDLAAILQAACVHFDPFGRQEGYPSPPLDLDNRRHVLDCLYHHVAPPSPRSSLVTCEAHKKAGSYVGRKNVSSILEKKPIKKMLSLPRGFIQHAGDINLFIKRMISATTAGNFPSAAELREVGILFAPCDSGDLREIKFDRISSSFLLPRITINDSTEVVLRNLVALELNLETEQKPLTRYTYLMDRLIDTERDVAVLKRRGVLISHMGSDAEVAQMWNSMSKSPWENRFDPVDKAIEEANKYYSNRWRVLLAELVKTHFSKPWLVVSVLSAGILLLLTAAQVFCLFYTCNKQ